ncbi:MAG: AmmeMemoRadiSam system radical SAM enzyme [Desulfobacteraceae bacterium]|nr:AmmeMemoRadiSam system radical SAM enzyme [Desulfobacteraceae bacterium]
MGKTVICELCPHLCRIEPGGRGECRVRYNKDGKLISLVYGKPCAVHLDPIEKKPMFHFLPSSKVFSIATAGCNLHCKFCQNWEISQREPEATRNVNLSPAQVVRDAELAGCRSVAYTYTDPSIFFEYTVDASKLAHAKGLKNVLVTAGYLNEKPMEELFAVSDGANIDFKGNDAYYQKYVGGRVKHVMRYIKKAIAAGVFVELTNLIIPTLNDKKEDIKWLIKWILDEVGPDVPLHFSRFHPMYQLTHLYPTPKSILNEAAAMAYDMGMHYVYVGNVVPNKFENTRCPNCKKDVIKRQGYMILKNDVVGGKCKFCKHKIPGVWQ